MKKLAILAARIAAPMITKGLAKLILQRTNFAFPTRYELFLKRGHSHLTELQKIAVKIYSKQTRIVYVSRWTELVGKTFSKREINQLNKLIQINYG